MHYVYKIKSEIRRNRTYLGCTDSLRRRLKEHNRGKNKATRKYRPWKLVYYEAYLSEKDAKQREKDLKGKGSKRATLKKQIKHSLRK